MKKTNELIKKLINAKARKAKDSEIRALLNEAAKQARIERHPAYLSLAKRAGAMNHFHNIGGVTRDNR